jgi:signal transduction histidine kinase
MGIVIVLFLAALFGKQRNRLQVQRDQLLHEVALLEGERSRISQDLHDDLGPLVSVAKIQLKLVRGVSAADAVHVAKAVGHLDELNERLRHTARHLTPRLLASKGLAAALHSFLEDYRELTSMEIRFEPLVRSTVETATGLQVYRMVQEMVQNAVKHSGATLLLVRLDVNSRRIELLCKDNGKGFCPDAAPQGLGLQNLRNRVALLGGEMECLSTPEQGTEYFLTLPQK